ncbi:hypothetical protein [Kitasatospora sp. NE20-6]|uniref:VHL beta domain-containing protein n=1 Tax=Kitasatospora sp. NE20-6 TaxID=2859066 RepID=UPI0038B2C939
MPTTAVSPWSRAAMWLPHTGQKPRLVLPTWVSYQAGSPRSPVQDKPASGKPVHHWNGLPAR